MRQGFTLIELLVVVLIMGILASVAMPQYYKSVEKSRSAEAQSALSAIASAQERAFMQKGSYAMDLSELDVGISSLNYFTISKFAEDLGSEIDIQAQRTIKAAGGLGKYRIALHIPVTPGTGARRWTCSPRPTCQALLPQ